MDQNTGITQRIIPLCLWSVKQKTILQEKTPLSRVPIHYHPVLLHIVVVFYIPPIPPLTPKARRVKNSIVPYAAKVFRRNAFLSAMRDFTQERTCIPAQSVESVFTGRADLLNTRESTPARGHSPARNAERASNKSPILMHIRALTQERSHFPAQSVGSVTHGRSSSPSTKEVTQGRSPTPVLSAVNALR